MNDPNKARSAVGWFRAQGRSPQRPLSVILKEYYRYYTIFMRPIKVTSETLFGLQSTCAATTTPTTTKLN